MEMMTASSRSICLFLNQWLLSTDHHNKIQAIFALFIRPLAKLIAGCNGSAYQHSILVDLDVTTFFKSVLCTFNCWMVQTLSPLLYDHANWRKHPFCALKGAGPQFLILAICRWAEKLDGHITNSQAVCRTRADLKIFFFWWSLKYIFFQDRYM